MIWSVGLAELSRCASLGVLEQDVELVSFDTLLQEHLIYINLRIFLHLKVFYIRLLVPSQKNFPNTLELFDRKLIRQVVVGIPQLESMLNSLGLVDVEHEEGVEQRLVGGDEHNFGIVPHLPQFCQLVYIHVDVFDQMLEHLGE